MRRVELALIRGFDWQPMAADLAHLALPSRLVPRRGVAAGAAVVRRLACRMSWRSCCDACFFFQAEDGIRDWSVTGVQTCALPIFVLNTLEWQTADRDETREDVRQLRISEVARDAIKMSCFIDMLLSLRVPQITHKTPRREAGIHLIDACKDHICEG